MPASAPPFYRSNRAAGAPFLFDLLSSLFSPRSGLLCGLSLGRDLRGLGTAELPGITAMGAMGRYISTPNRDFQPMNCTFGLLDGLLVDKQHKKIRNKQERYTVISERSLNYLRDWVTEMQV